MTSENGSIDLGIIIDNLYEIRIIKSMDKNNFLWILRESNIDVNKCLGNRFATNIHRDKLNFVISKLNRDDFLSVRECVLYLEEEFLEINAIMKILSDENLETLRMDLAKSYNIKLPKNKIKKYLV